MVGRSLREPTMLALTSVAARTQPPMMVPRPERTCTVPSLYTSQLTIQSVCRLSLAWTRQFSRYLAYTVWWAVTTAWLLPSTPLATTRSPPASTVLASTTPSTVMLPVARTVKPLQMSP